jgi:hypothetical protein
LKKELKNAVLRPIFERKKTMNANILRSHQDKLNDSNATEQISAEIDHPRRKGEGQKLFLESNALLQIHSN